MRVLSWSLFCHQLATKYSMTVPVLLSEETVASMIPLSVAASRPGLPNINHAPKARRGTLLGPPLDHAIVRAHSEGPTFRTNMNGVVGMPPEMMLMELPGKRVVYPPYVTPRPP